MNGLNMALFFAKSGNEGDMSLFLGAYYDMKKMPDSYKVRGKLYDILTKEGLPYKIAQEESFDVDFRSMRKIYALRERLSFLEKEKKAGVYAFERIAK